jgi:ribonuclease P protein component
MERLTKRSEYLEVARGGRTPRRGFLLQSIARRPAPAEGDAAPPVLPARFGFTVTKKIGNAVVRNRIRRRLKEAVRLEGALAARPGTDYVLVGRRAALDQPFSELVADVVGALKAPARDASQSGGRGPRQDTRKKPVNG